MISYPKELFIETLREFFSQDSYYRYQRDEWGFAKVIDLTDVPLEAGLNDDVTTRLFIGESNRYDPIYFPALIVKSGGSRYVPISMNREKDSIQWNNTRFIDGYGNESIISTPAYLIQAGAWEGQITVEVETRSLRSRDELAELVSLAFVDTRFDDLKNAGVLIKGVSASGPSDTEDRNDRLFKQTISFDIRSEWRRHIPVTSVVDVIHVCLEFGNLVERPFVLAPNLKVSTTIELIEALVGS